METDFSQCEWLPAWVVPTQMGAEIIKSELGIDTAVCRILQGHQIKGLKEKKPRMD